MLVYKKKIVPDSLYTKGIVFVLYLIILFIYKIIKHILFVY